MLSSNVDPDLIDLKINPRHIRISNKSSQDFSNGAPKDLMFDPMQQLLGGDADDKDKLSVPQMSINDS